MLTATGKICIVLFLLAIALILIPCIGGCTRLLDLDRHIWSPVTQTEAEAAAAKPPPVLEVIAGALALVGFGGMANWIRRVKVKQEKMKTQLNNHTANENKTV